MHQHRNGQISIRIISIRISIDIPRKPSSLPPKFFQILLGNYPIRPTQHGQDDPEIGVGQKRNNRRSDDDENGSEEVHGLIGAAEGEVAACEGEMVEVEAKLNFGFGDLEEGYIFGFGFWANSVGFRACAGIHTGVGLGR